jgi:hypothetical protein
MVRKSQSVSRDCLRRGRSSLRRRRGSWEELVKSALHLMLLDLLDARLQVESA